MAKKGFELNTLTKLISSDSDKPNWSLCVGAGISAPLFPDWYSLAQRLANTLIPSQELSENMIKKMGFSADALIQMVKNASKLSDQEFALKMSEILYSDFRNSISEKDWKTIVKVFEANHLNILAPNDWKTFNAYRNDLIKNTTSFVLANSIFNAIEADAAPKSILSFNAEPLLLVTLNSLLMEHKTDINHPLPKQLFNKVTGSLSNQNDKRIQYVFCHGLLPMTEDSNKFSYSTQKLVFSEDEYLQIANNSFSWQSNIFLNTCTTQHIIFIGTSLTDPNMRRWLSWTHSNRLNEMKELELTAEESTQHYWIKKKPDDKTLMPWIESAVSHLGVRLIWIDEWSQSGEALEIALGIKTPRELNTQTKHSELSQPVNKHKKNIKIAYSNKKRHRNKKAIYHK